MPKIILKQTEPEQVLYTYPYGSFNTGQDVSYATGDDKDIRDTVFDPEIASWDTSLAWSFPVLDPTDFTKLLKGSNPDGSGNNIYGNLERFTDVNGNRADIDDNYFIDHLTGLGISFFRNRNNYNFLSAIEYSSTLVEAGFSDYHWPNAKELLYVLNNQQSSLALNYSPFFVTQDHETITTTRILRTGTTNEILRMINGSYLLTISGTVVNNLCYNISFRKAFTYNATTKEMELS